LKVNKALCLFEQSGTFKNEFIKLGIPAEDYDILNDFGETNNVCDLFAEIKRGYNNEPSIFDNVTPDDLIIAFFPCVRFENQINLWFRGQASQQASWTLEKKIKYDIDLMKEVAKNYELFNQLFLICINRGLKLIVENPFSEEHFLRRYWCLPPSLIDKDRTERGDYYRKPTQYWFLNCKPSNNMIFEFTNFRQLEVTTRRKDTWASTRDYSVTGAKNREVARSMIHPEYANRFIREFILDERK